MSETDEDFGELVNKMVEKLILVRELSNDADVISDQLRDARSDFRILRDRYEKRYAESLEEIGEEPT